MSTAVSTTLVEAVRPDACTFAALALQMAHDRNDYRAVDTTLDDLNPAELVHTYDLIAGAGGQDCLDWLATHGTMSELLSALRDHDQARIAALRNELTPAQWQATRTALLDRLAQRWTKPQEESDV